jgi:hypothetical protein
MFMAVRGKLAKNSSKSFTLDRTWKKYPAISGGNHNWRRCKRTIDPNFGGKGNTLGFIFGMPPKLTGRTGTGLGLPDRDSAFHIETLYKFKLSDNLEMTPGILVITNPENNRLNPTEYVGTLRTTFKF